nr:molybdopterin biosynthesis protein [Pseudonocardiales bacterium]
YVHRGVDGSAELRAAVPPYQHVRSIGEDISATELLLPEGHRLRPVDVAACAAAGATELMVRRQPLVVIIPTGDEIRPLGTDPLPGEILDTNSLMLAAQATEIGCGAEVTGIIADDPGLITAALRDAAVRADLVILVAGSSAGRDDYTARVVAAAGTLAVHGVAVRPGHPVVLGTVTSGPTAGEAGTPVLGAPGYPVSAALTFDIFAAPLLAALEGTAPRERPSTTARLARKLASAIGTDDWIRVRLGRVKRDGIDDDNVEDIVATPLPRGAGVLTSLVRADGLLVVPAGVEGHHAGEQVRVQLLRGLSEIGRTIVAIGSHDLVLDVAASALRATDPLITLASSNVGSLGGLVALRDGLCHIAGSHLLDPATNTYTLPFVDSLLGEGPDIAVVRLVHRDQGLIVPPGNPHGLTGIDDLAVPGLRYVNRQRGAGTRALLDHELAQRDIDPARVSGYTREEHTHLAVAAAVAAGRADTGMGIQAAARAFNLDFVPIAREPYDLVMRANMVEDGLLAPLWALLERPDFQAGVEALGGYSCVETGRRIR